MQPGVSQCPENASRSVSIRLSKLRVGNVMDASTRGEAAAATVEMFIESCQHLVA